MENHIQNHKEIFTNEELQCVICDQAFGNQRQLSRHMKGHSSDEDGNANCNNCDYQGSSKQCLEKHKNITGHKGSEETVQNHMEQKHQIICFKCKEGFGSFPQLMEHKKVTHPSKRRCRNLPNCEHGDKCWYLHPEDPAAMEVSSNDDKSQEDSRKECNDCGYTFRNKNELMQHRKKDHPSARVCRDLLAGGCSRGDGCWYRHQLPYKARDEDFPPMPTTGRSPAVGHETIQQQLLNMLMKQQKQQQTYQQEQQKMMAQLMKMM
jgi:uncharacterized C2H2 Zn-finger protein